MLYHFTLKSCRADRIKVLSHLTVPKETWRRGKENRENCESLLLWTKFHF